MARAAADHTLTLASTSESAARTIVFNPITDLSWTGRRRLRFHPNALSLTAYRDDDATPELHNEVWYSIGGGFVVRDDGTGEPPMPRDETRVPHPFRNGANCSISARPAACRFRRWCWPTRWRTATRRTRCARS
nr:serine dehydratase beta chain [Propionibacterium freudenreichii]